MGPAVLKYINYYFSLSFANITHFTLINHYYNLLSYSARAPHLVKTSNNIELIVLLLLIN